jgi:mRNA interferase MazF
VVNSYIPERGDIIRIKFNPQAGKEHAGHRSALVLSEKKYNQVIGLSILCPITSKEKGYPFEVKISLTEVSVVILADHVKNFDWRERKATFIAKAPEPVVDEVIHIINTIIGKKD